jgi:Delta7-sterol 5-desaturase
MSALALLLYSPSPLALLIWAASFFLCIYLIMASILYWLAKYINRPIETKLVSAAQIRTELAQSLRSILLFGIGMIVPWLMLRYGLTKLSLETNAAIIVLEFVLLVLWNDLHFYVIHRFLHSKLKWAHITHHKSVAATPFAAYSMSATEAVLLGSVMPLAMLVHDFSLAALIFLPIWSITINAIAHSNCNLFPKVSEHSLLTLVRHHQSHHSSYKGNYSFFFNQLDRWSGTSRPF